MIDFKLSVFTADKADITLCKSDVLKLTRSKPKLTLSLLIVPSGLNSFEFAIVTPSFLMTHLAPCLVFVRRVLILVVFGEGLLFPTPLTFL